jgi:hypothetical protein
MSEWVSPTLSDGLGNRLFQIAAAAGAAAKYKRQLVFYLPRCHKASHSNPKDIFSLFPSVPIIESGLSSWKEIPEKHFATYEPFPSTESLTEGLVIRGFRQSEHYFTPQDLPPFNFKKALGEDTYERLTRRELSDSAFIHIRLGDYRFLPHHQVNLESYWIQTLQEVISKGAKHLLVFSDEPQYIKNIMLPFFQQFDFAKIEVSEEVNPIGDLYLMSQCLNGAICANSTFSWWGSYLAKQNGCKSIYMPSKWGEGALADVPDLIPEWAIKI